MDINIVQKALSSKDGLISKALQTVAEYILCTDEDGNIDEEEELAHNVGSAEEQFDKLRKKTEAVIGELPMIFQTRHGQAIRNYVLQRKAEQSKAHFVVVPKKETDVPTMAAKYKRAFDAWIDSEDVSFMVSNPMNTKLSLKDLFILHFYAFATCQRQYNDNILSLIVSGVTSCYKSTLFENPLLSTAHNYTTTGSGCGRLVCDSSNLILCHDISLPTFLFSKDADTFRAILRAEVAKTKIHSSEKNIPPQFVCITTNDRAFTHVFKSNEIKQDKPIKHHQLLISNMFKMHKPTQDDVYKSSIIPETTSRQFSKVESVYAFQNRVLEVFCRKKPANLDVDDLPESGTVFNRWHLIFGLMDRVFNIMKAHPKEDFPSRMLYKYVLWALKKTVGDYVVYYNICHPQQVQHYWDSVDEMLADLNKEPPKRILDDDDDEDVPLAKKRAASLV